MVLSYFGTIGFVCASSSMVLAISPEEAAVNELNAAFDGFDPNKDDSPLGVTLRWQSPGELKFWCGEGCEGFGSDCRTSAVLYNHMIQWDGKYVNPIFWSLAKGGIAFKPTAVQTMLARCAYMIDSNSVARLNHGCGCQTDEESACKNTDPSSGKPYNGSSPDVARCHCDTDPKEPETTATACYYKGPAFNAGQKNNELQRFVSNRVRQPFEEFQNSFTEVVLDSAVINAHLEKDMSSIITALFVGPSCDAQCKADVLKWRDQIAQQYASEPLPVVGVELTAHNSPFHVLPSEEESHKAWNSPEIAV